MSTAYKKFKCLIRIIYVLTVFSANDFIRWVFNVEPTIN